MKIFQQFLLIASLFSFSISNAVPSESNSLRDAISTKFKQSSQGVLNNVEQKVGLISISASTSGIGDSNDVLIDIAIALNRIDGKIAAWKTASISIDQKLFSFSRHDFDLYRSGKINDPQFLKRIKKKK